MIELLFFDYVTYGKPGAAYSSDSELKKLMSELTDRLKKMPEINYDSIEPVTGFSSSKKLIEQKLAQKDVLLIHPGSYNQNIVTVQWPKQFPNLNIGVLTIFGDSYKPKKRKKIKILNLRNIDEIIEFTLSAKKT